MANYLNEDNLINTQQYIFYLKKNHLTIIIDHKSSLEGE